MAARSPADVDRLFAAALSASDLTLAELIALQPTLNCHEIDGIANGDIAVLRARWTFSGTSEDGQPDGTWRFTIDLPSGAG